MSSVFCCTVEKHLDFIVCIYNDNESNSGQLFYECDVCVAVHSQPH